MKYNRGYVMKELFDEIEIYCKKNEKLILLPTGELKTFSTNIVIEPSIIIDLPISVEELKIKVEECFKLCWTQTIETAPRGQSSIEKILKVRSYKKVVEMCDTYTIKFDKKEKKYYVIKPLKAKNLKYYEGLDFQYEWESIKYEELIRLFQD